MKTETTARKQDMPTAATTTHVNVWSVRRENRTGTSVFFELLKSDMFVKPLYGFCP